MRERAARLAMAAAADTVAHVGGRPDLRADVLWSRLARADATADGPRA